MKNIILLFPLLILTGCMQHIMTWTVGDMIGTFIVVSSAITMIVLLVIDWINVKWNKWKRKS